ncbi:MAG: hypothetical protein ACI4F4_09680 [Lachnospiraceae bacterium]
MHISSIDDFERALLRLDQVLENQNIETIQVRAIGGFAMMYYRVNEHRYTIDIDSLTEEFDDCVLSAIRSVGLELGLEDDWLNTDCALLDGFLDGLASEINWKKSRYIFKHINLYVADEIGLLRSKAKAIHDGGLVPRSTDKKDLISLLKMLDIHNIYELDKCNELYFIKGQYCRCYDYLSVIHSW